MKCKFNRWYFWHSELWSIFYGLKFQSNLDLVSDFENSDFITVLNWVWLCAEHRKQNGVRQRNVFVTWWDKPFVRVPQMAFKFPIKLKTTSTNKSFEVVAHTLRVVRNCLINIPFICTRLLTCISVTFSNNSSLHDVKPIKICVSWIGADYNNYMYRSHPVEFRLLFESSCPSARILENDF